MVYCTGLSVFPPHCERVATFIGNFEGLSSCDRCCPFTVRRCCKRVNAIASLYASSRVRERRVGLSTSFLYATGQNTEETSCMSRQLAKIYQNLSQINLAIRALAITTGGVSLAKEGAAIQHPTNQPASQPGGWAGSQAGSLQSTLSALGCIVIQCKAGGEVRKQSR